MLEKNYKMHGEKRSFYHFILLTYHSFQLIFSILKAINSAEFAVESIICRTSFEFCQLAHLYNFCQPAIIWIMCTFFSLSNFAVKARRLKWYYDKNRMFRIKAILKHKQVVCMRRKMPFTFFKYLFSFQRYSSF